MGPVFRGEDGETRQRVVIKVIRVGLPPEKVAVLAASLAGLRARWPAHPALAPLIDTGVVDVEPYVVTPWIDGDSLDVALRDYGPAHLSDAVPRLRRLGEAIDTAAAAGWAHGSLHLRDIMVSVEQTVLTGMGLAPLLEKVGVRPPVRRPYSAPEVAKGGVIRIGSDQYSLAAIAYEWLSGRRLAGTQSATFHLPAATTAGAEAIGAVFERALAEDPDDRYPSAVAFVDALGMHVADMMPRQAASRGARRATSEAPRLAFDDTAETADAGDRLGFAPPAPDPDRRDLDDDRDDAVGAFEADVPLGASSKLASTDTSRPDEHVDDSAAAAPMSLAGASADDVAADVPLHPDVVPPSDLVWDDADEGAPITGAAGGAIDEPEPDPAFSRIEDDEVGEMPVTEAEGAPDASTDGDSRWGLWAGALLLAVLVVVGGGWGLLRWGTPSARPTGGAVSSVSPTHAPPAPPPAPAPAPQETAPSTPPRAAVTPAPEAPVAPAPAPAATTGAPATPARPAVQVAPAAPVSSPAATSARRPTTPSGPARPAAPARPVASGRLLVRTSPAGADVFVNGERRGVSPLALRELSPGTYTVRVSRPGFVAAEQRVVITAGRPSRAIDVAMRRQPAAAPARPAPARPAPARPDAASATGSLLVDSRPAGARVVVDGRDVGVTPITVPALAAGTHTVRLERAGFMSIATTARIEPGARARVAVTLTAERPR